MLKSSVLYRACFIQRLCLERRQCHSMEESAAVLSLLCLVFEMGRLFKTISLPFRKKGNQNEKPKTETERQ